MQYIAGRKRGDKGDFSEEGALAQGWLAAGAKLAMLPPPAYDLANQYFLKAEYWSDPDAWSEQQIDTAKFA